MKHLGDVITINGAEVEPVDIITFGSPCQDLSIAGKQAGLLGGSRSSLFYEATRIIREMRKATNEQYPRFIMWENVPGAFSSNKGNDFRAVLEEICSIGGYTLPITQPPRSRWLTAGEIVGDSFSVAWRVLDAQYWGVPQRRRRIYLVADFRGGCAPEILFKREGLSWNTEEGAKPREGVAADAMGSVDRGGRDGCLTPWDCQSKRLFDLSGISLPFCARESGGNNKTIAIVYPKKARTLTDLFDGPPSVDRGQPFVCHESGQGYWMDGFGCLRAEGENRPSRPSHVVAYDCRNHKAQEVCGTLQAKPNGGQSLNYINPVCYDARGNGNGETVATISGDHNNRVSDYTSLLCMAHSKTKAEMLTDQCPALNCNHEQSILSLIHKPPRKYIVRRLTPLECCRLQGMPDWWTDGVEGSDSAKYKMWGNGMCLQCVLYIMQGLKLTLQRCQ